MLKSMIAVFVLLLALASLAQTPSIPATDVSSAQIHAFINALPRDVVSDRPIRVVDVGGYHVGVFGVFRPGAIKQEANLHQTSTAV